MDFLKEKCNCMRAFIFCLFVLSALIFSCKEKADKLEVKALTELDTVNLPSPANPPATALEYLITDTTFGKINKTTTYNDLDKMFGKKNIQDTINYGAEGMDSFIVTKIFSNTPKEIVINWQTDKFHNAIATVDCFHDNSSYHTIDSLAVGSTLQKLVQVNGKKINFYGTGWDYGGLITSYNDGKFKRSKIFFSLNSTPGASGKVMGERELNTDMPLVKQNLNKLYISKISLSLHNER
jgi:hypothetical protein